MKLSNWGAATWCKESKSPVEASRLGRTQGMTRASLYRSGRKRGPSRKTRKRMARLLTAVFEADRHVPDRIKERSDCSWGVVRGGSQEQRKGFDFHKPRQQDGAAAIVKDQEVRGGGSSNR